MTEEDFVAAMRCLFQQWYTIDNAEAVLIDVVNTIGHQCFGRESKDLPALVRECRLSRPPLRPAANSR